MHCIKIYAAISINRFLQVNWTIFYVEKWLKMSNLKKKTKKNHFVICMCYLTIHLRKIWILLDFTFHLKLMPIKLFCIIDFFINHPVWYRHLAQLIDFFFISIQGRDLFPVRRNTRVNNWTESSKIYQNIIN